MLRTAAETVNAEGFANATTNRIVERAGVTWGVLQYHFGDKSGLLWALVDEAFCELREGFERMECEGDSASERVASILDQAWALFQTPMARASMEVLGNIRFARGPSHPERRRVNAMQRTVARLGRGALSDAIGRSHGAETVQTLVWMAVRGWSLAAMQGTEFDRQRERQSILAFARTILDAESTEPGDGEK